MQCTDVSDKPAAFVAKVAIYSDNITLKREREVYKAKKVAMRKTWN